MTNTPEPKIFEYKLPPLGINKDIVTVCGMSSGSFEAMQL